MVKMATVMKNTVAPLQAAQAALIAKRVALINLRLTMYREQFKLKEVHCTISNIDDDLMTNDKAVWMKKTYLHQPQIT